MYDFNAEIERIIALKLDQDGIRHMWGNLESPLFEYLGDGRYDGCVSMIAHWDNSCKFQDIIDEIRNDDIIRTTWDGWNQMDDDARRAELKKFAKYQVKYLERVANERVD